MNAPPQWWDDVWCDIAQMAVFEAVLLSMGENPDKDRGDEPTDSPWRREFARRLRVAVNHVKAETLKSESPDWNRFPGAVNERYRTVRKVDFIDWHRRRRPRWPLPVWLCDSRAGADSPSGSRESDHIKLVGEQHKTKILECILKEGFNPLSFPRQLPERGYTKSLIRKQSRHRASEHSA